MHYAMPITQRLKKMIKSLQQKQARDQNFLFVGEGEKICFELLESEYQPELIVLRDSPSFDILEITDKFAEKGIPVYSAPKHQFDQICAAKTPQGLLAVVNKKEIHITPDDYFIALDGINDPGNLGTIIRTAEWFGIKQIIIGNESADHFSPKAVRSSMGSIFRQKVIYTDDLAGYLKTNFKKIEKFAASLDAKSSILTMKPKDKFGLIFGSESHGISEDVKKIVNKSFVINGSDHVDSLNVGISVGISLFHFSSYIK